MPEGSALAGRGATPGGHAPLHYGFVVDDAHVTEEWLHAWPRGRKQVWFEREDIHTFRFGVHLKGENRSASTMTRSNGLFLSAAAQNNHVQLTPIYDWFRSCAVYDDASHADSERAYLDGGRKRDLLELLSAADLGVVDVQVEADERATYGHRVRLRHAVEGSDAWLPLQEESHGTRSLFYLAPVLHVALRGGKLLVIDELEAGLHPLIASWIVGLFNEPRSNPNHAQVLFTTHDTQILGTLLDRPNHLFQPVLRRDQVWLTEKNREGATRLFPLTHYKPRKAENVERGYLQGRYGAVPVPLDPIVGEAH